MRIFTPITKVDAEKRLVYGILSAEVADKSNDILDYATAKPAFEEWSRQFFEATGGKSFGNVRAMHSSIAAGKLTDLTFDDDARRSDKQRIAEWFQTHNTDVFDESTYAPSYNVAPITFQPVVRLNRETGEREIAYMRWWLVPFWSKDSKPSFSNVNAKAETVTTSATYREAIKTRRCLVPADFFYEWQKIDAKKKQPYAIGMKDGSMFAFAGLWERWKDKASGNALETFTVITTDPNELMEKIHNRMSIILHRKDYDRWLEPGDPQRPPIDLLRPFPAKLMKAWKVGKDVCNVRDDNPSPLRGVVGWRR